CSYHGWRFDGTGACTRIPQALDPAAEAAACRSRRACATAYPVRLEAGMLWVWPDDSPDAAATAAAAPLLMTSRLRQRGAEYDKHVGTRLATAGTAPREPRAGPPPTPASATTTAGNAPTTTAASQVQQAPKPIDWFVREMPMSYEVLIENLLDPAHLPFSHHGQTPALKRSAGKAMPMRPRKTPTAPSNAVPAAAASADAPATTVASSNQDGSHSQASIPYHWSRPTGPDVEMDFAGNISPNATISWTAPHLVTYSYRMGQTEMLIELLAVPVAPGRSRFLSPNTVPMPGSKPPPLPPLHLLGLQRAAFLLMMKLDPVVTHHRALNQVLDGDTVFLCSQDELLRGMQAEADAEAAAGSSSSAGTSGAGSSSGSSSDATTTGGGDSDSGAGKWSRLYFLPTQADRAVLAARRWLEERAGGGPFSRRQQREQKAAGARPLGGEGMGLPPTSQQRQQMPPVVLTPLSSPEVRARLLSRYEQHTRHCP
ncbi:hypothetical protein Agub_g9071, partial [Astrephomene gubernaculifera]